MYKKILGIVGFTCALVLNQAAFAHSWECRESLKSVLDSLKLDDAQKDKIKPVLEQFKSTVTDLGTQMDGLDKQINQQDDSANMDKATVNGLIEKKGQLIGEMMKAKMNAKNQIKAVLNEEQKKELHDKLLKMEEKVAAEFQKCHDDD